MPLNSTSMPRIYDIISGFLLLPSNSWHNKFDLFFCSLSPQYVTILQTYVMTNHYDNQHLIVYPTQLQSDLFWAVAGTVGSLIYSHSIGPKPFYKSQNSVRYVSILWWLKELSYWFKASFLLKILEFFIHARWKR